MKEWQPDMRYTDTYWSRANNEEEYKTLVKRLYDERVVTNRYLGSEWDENKQLIDNLCMWHEYFDTDCMYDDKYEEEDMPEPNEYNGDFRYKPESQEYPIVILFEQLDSKPMMSWYSISE
jgi:hypothetical protein